MKKSALLLIISFIFILASSGFSQIQVGPAAGVNLSGLSITPDVAGRTTNIKPGYTAGAVIIYNLSSMFSLQLEPAYIQKGSLIKTAQTDMGLILEVKQTAEINYVDIPVSFRLSFEGESIKPFLFTGMNISFPLEDIKIRTDNVTINGQDFTQMVPADLLEQKIKTKKIDYGFNFGAGISFPLSTMDLFFSVQYNLGLADLNDELLTDEQLIQGEQQAKIKNKGLQVKTGILLAF